MFIMIPSHLFTEVRAWRTMLSASFRAHPGDCNLLFVGELSQCSDWFFGLLNFIYISWCSRFITLSGFFFLYFWCLLTAAGFFQSQLRQKRCPRDLETIDRFYWRVCQLRIQNSNSKILLRWCYVFDCSQILVSRVIITLRQARF